MLWHERTLFRTVLQKCSEVSDIALPCFMCISILLVSYMIMHFPIVRLCGMKSVSRTSEIKVSYMNILGGRG